MAENEHKLLAPTTKPPPRGPRLNDETKEREDDHDVLEATDRAIREYGFCPNRVWAVARSHNRRERVIPMLFPGDDKNLKQLFPPQEQGSSKRNDHASCTFDFCEQSEMNATNVAQRHESPSCRLHPCQYVGYGGRSLFERDVLNRAVDDGKPTAWQLNGIKLVQLGQKYMAISHVWSDGTGIGGHRPGEVNKCLYDYFGSVARKFQCDAMWWDTLCIPSEKMARAKALNNMHLNYREAEMTFVHDCFLRELDPPDYETACVALLMSPWFSRGWTALELAHSNKVQVAFKRHIMDLDEILYKPQRIRHAVAASAIEKLRRQEYINLDRLLQVLSSRYTSWARDMTIIAGLLVGLTFDPAKAPAATDKDDVQYQQSIYLDVLRKIGRISYENLFHNLPTVCNGSSWCPAKLLLLPIGPPMTSSETMTSSVYGLKVTSNGDVVGEWKVVPIDFWSTDSFTLRDAHPLVAVRLRTGLKDREHHRCLVPPLANIDRVLLARTARDEQVFKFVGCLQLRHTIRRLDIPFKATKVVILNGEDTTATDLDNLDEDSLESSEKNVSGLSPGSETIQNPGLKIGIDWIGSQSARAAEGERPRSSLSRPTAVCLLLDRPSPFETESRLHEWSKYNKHIQYNSEHGKSFSVVDHELLNAAKAGDERRVKHLLRIEGATPTVFDKDGRSALSWAAGMGHSSIVTLLCDFRRAYSFSEEEGRDYTASRTKRCIVDDMSERATILRNKLDKNGRSPLSWAADEGQVECVQTLLRYPEIDIDAADPDGWTPLWYAADKGNIVIMKLLIAAGATTNRSIDSGNQCLLGRLSCRSPAHLIKLLIDNNDDPKNDLVYYQAIENAAKNGNISAVRLLLDEGIDPETVTPDDERSPLMYAIRNTQVEVIRVLLDAGTSDVNRGVSLSRFKSFPSNVALPLWTPLLEAVWIGLPEGFNAALVGEPPRPEEIVQDRLSIIKMLLDTGKVDVNRKHKISEKLELYRDYTRGLTALHKAAEHGDDAVVKLLLGMAEIDVNIQDTGGETALFLAAEGGHASTVELLLQTNKPDMNLKASRYDKSGLVEWRHYTPLEMAKKKKHHEVVDVFRKDAKRRKQQSK